MIRTALLSTAICLGFLATDADAKDRRPDFAALDANADGKITATEIANFGAARATERFQSADANKDGVLSRDELVAIASEGGRVDRLMARLDRDGDAVLSVAEVTQMTAGRQTGRRTGHRTGHRAEQMIARLDSNGDGAIDAAEYANAARRGLGGRAPKSQ